MRLGLIGIGRAGRIHLEAAGAVDGVRLVAVADRSPAARRCARAEGLHAYADALDMIARERLDAVTICTPPATHAPIAIACLERGLHVLCEKPLAIHGYEALQMLRTAMHVRRHLLLATKFRHVPDLVRARDLIDAGRIGEPVGFEIHFSSIVDMGQRWNSRRAVAGGGVVIDNGCHAFDIVAFLFGTVERVHATRLKPLQSIPVEDSATVLVAAGRGLVGRIDLSWSLATARPAFVTVYGSRGTIEVGWHGSRLLPAGAPAEDIGIGYDKGDTHRRMLGSFRDLVAGEGRAWITPGECLRTVAAVESAYWSLRSGGWVPVDMMGVRDPRRRLKATA